jgi:hypothetical protein
MTGVPVAANSGIVIAYLPSLGTIVAVVNVNVHVASSFTKFAGLVSSFTTPTFRSTPGNRTGVKSYPVITWSISTVVPYPSLKVVI